MFITLCLLLQLQSTLGTTTIVSLSEEEIEERRKGWQPFTTVS